MSEDEDNEKIISLRGMVVDYSMPSRAVLVDWLKKEINDVRLKEVVELFPKEIFNELETIRRQFYYRMEVLTVPAYSLKILPMDALPKFQKVIQQTKKRFEKLDEEIKKALKDRYTKKAIDYYQDHGSKARIVSSISHRFSVLMMPFRIDALIWQEFLDESLQRQLDAIHKRYENRKKDLENNLEKIQGQLDETKKDLERSSDDVAKAYEGMTLPVDVATLRIERKELQGKVKGLKYQMKKLQREINSLEWKKKDEVTTYQSSSRWAYRQTQETEKRISFDATKLYQDQLENMVRNALETFDLDAKNRNRTLTNYVEAAKKTWDRIMSLMPTSRLGTLYEKSIIAMKKALDGKLEDAKKELEELS